MMDSEINQSSVCGRLIAIVVALAWCSLSAVAFGGTCNWQLDPYDRYDGVIFPDSNVTYWRISLQFDTNTTPRFRIRGSLPRARYAGLILYRTDTGNPISSLSDDKLRLDSAPTSATPQYTAWLAPTDAADLTTNVIRYPKPVLKPMAFEFWYRVYLPDPNTDERGSVPLPTVEALAEDGTPIACPEVTRKRASSSGGAANLPLIDDKPEIVFHRSNGQVASANPDNAYLFARLPFTPERTVAVVRFHPPEVVPLGKSPRTSSSARYWSMCLGGVSGETTDCLADNGAPIDDKGQVTVVVGPESLEASALARGFAFLPRAKLFLPLLVYRNLLARSTPEMPTGTLLSEKDFLAAYPERGSNGRKAVRTPVAAVKVPPHDDHTIRFGVSRDLFLGMYWHQMLSRADRARAAHQEPALWTIMGDTLTKMLRERTGYSVELPLLSTDSIGATLEREGLDFALIPGFEYPWLKRFFPNVDPIAYGVSDYGPRGRTRVHLLALPQVIEHFGGTPGNTPLARLRSARLAIYPARPESLFALYQGLLAEGLNPEGFFRPSLAISDNAEDALACVARNEVVGATGQISRCADVVLIEDNAYQALTNNRPGYMKNAFDILWTSPPVPLPMVIYSPVSVRRTMEGRFRAGLDESSPIENFIEGGLVTKTQKAMLELALRQAFGIKSFSLVDADYPDTVNGFEDQMRTIPEYFLPLLFFPTTSFERRDHQDTVSRTNGGT